MRKSPVRIFLFPKCFRAARPETRSRKNRENRRRRSRGRRRRDSGRPAADRPPTSNAYRTRTRGPAPAVRRPRAAYHWPDRPGLGGAPAAATRARPGPFTRCVSHAVEPLGVQQPAANTPADDPDARTIIIFIVYLPRIRRRAPFFFF